jgi:hypothetical protein
MNPDIPESLDRILTNWSRWMHRDSAVDGFPQRSAVLTTGGASKGWDDFAEEIDGWVAQTVDTCINDLPADQRAAVHHCYLRAVFRFRDYRHSLLLAVTTLGVMLEARNVCV